MSFIVAITGTPGTGKTTLSNQLCSHFKEKNKKTYLISQDELVQKTKSSIGFDEVRNSIIVNEEKLRKNFKKSFEKELNEYELVIIDSHISHELKENVNFVIITKCNLDELRKRLIKKNYHNAKIQENLNAELLNIIGNEVEEYNLKHVYFFTSDDQGLKEVFNAIIEFDELAKKIEDELKMKTEK